MKHIRKHIVVVFIITLMVAAVPVSSYGEQAITKQSFTIDGTRYLMEKTHELIRVQEIKGGTAIRTCTAYLDDEYLLSETNTNNKMGKKVTEVTKLGDLVNTANLAGAVFRKSSIVKPWTLDGKYIYNPVQVSSNPAKYKEHTAYYMYRPILTKSVTRQINFSKGTAIPTIAVAIELIIATVCYFIAPPLAVALTIDLVSSVGLTVAGGCITAAFAPTLAVDATNYEAKFVDSLGVSNGQTFKGGRLTVTDVESSRFQKSYYDGYAPQISQNFAYTAFLNTFRGSFVRYPGLKAYVEY